MLEHYTALSYFFKKYSLSLSKGYCSLTSVLSFRHQFRTESGEKKKKR